MRFLPVFLLAILFSYPAHASATISHHLRHRKPLTHIGALLATDPTPQGPIAGATPGTFTELIDHPDADEYDQTRNHHHVKGTFQQRYYINTSAASGPDAPVILIICGEYTCDQNELLSGGLDEGGIDEYVKEFHANLVILEHRYYGKSQPFKDLSTKHLKFLTTDQALKDIVTFHDFIVNTKHLTGPWVSIGGSYAAELSAFIRVSRPDVISGALSSSGPVHLQIDFPQYDQHASNAIPKVCADQVRADIAYFEGALTNPALMAELRKDYAAPAKEDDLDFLDAIEGLADGSIQYSEKDAFCAAIQETGTPADWLKYSQATGATGAGLWVDLSDVHDFDDGARQWEYQSCTEYGYFQSAYPDPNQSLLPRRVTLEYELAPCKKFFKLSGVPDVDIVTDRFVNPIFNNPTVTNILFTNAQDDPWTELGITPSNSSLPDGLGTFEYSVYAHHGDLKPTTPDIPPSVQAAKDKFRTLVAQWIAL